MPSNAVHGRKKWIVLGFAFSATVINYLDRQTLSVMAPVLLERFHISAGSYSHIIFAFMLAYTLMNGVSGTLLDRLGSKIGYALTIAWWSSAELLHALSSGALSLVFFRFLLGAGEAGNYPAGVKLIAEWFPVEERSMASGIFNSGAAIGAILAPPLIAWVFLCAGWQAVFIIVGLLGFIWLAAWLYFYQNTPRLASTSRATRIPVKVLLRSKFLWQFTLSKVFSDPVWYFYTFWFPQYLRVVHRYTMRQIGQMAWIPFATAAIGNVAGGILFRILLRFGSHATTARRIAILIFSLLMMFAGFVGFVHGPYQCIALISVATFGYSGALANLLAVPADIFSKDAVASVWGLASMGSGFGGMIFSLITGWLVDHYSFRPVFLLFGILPLFSAWIVWKLPKEMSPEAIV